MFGNHVKIDNAIFKVNEILPKIICAWLGNYFTANVEANRSLWRLHHFYLQILHKERERGSWLCTWLNLFFPPYLRSVFWLVCKTKCQYLLLAITPGPTVHWLFRSHDLPSKFSMIASGMCDRLANKEMNADLDPWSIFHMWTFRSVHRQVVRPMNTGL